MSKKKSHKKTKNQGDNHDYNKWEKMYGHMNKHTGWDKKGRKCKNPKCDHTKLGVDYSVNPPVLFCPFCFTRYGEA